MNAPSGISFRIFVPSGDPEGLRIVEKANWIGQGLAFPRPLLGEVRKRQELKRTGVYVLWGPSNESQLPRVYIGEGDPVQPRLEQHARSKDFWTHAIVFTSKDQSLNKAHVQYLEARLVQLASEAKRAELDNGNVPQLPTLSEADAADAEAFLRDLLLCLPIMGVTFFERANAEPGLVQQELYLESKRGNITIKARGFDSSGGFIVYADSKAFKDKARSIPKHLQGLRESLVNSGVLEDEGQTYRLTQDYSFNSPSTAAGVLLGRSVNGLTHWKDKSGRTLKEIRNEALGTGTTEETR